MNRLDFTFPVNLWNESETVSVSALFDPEMITENEVIEQVGMHRTSISNHKRDFNDKIVIFDTTEADKLMSMIA